MPLSFATEPASQTQRRLAWLLVGGLCMATVVAYFWAGVPLPQFTPFLPSYGVAIFLIDSLTAYLLAVQFRLTRMPSVLMLAMGYLYSGLIVLPHLLVFPGVFSPTGLFDAGSQSAIWLWVFWHGGFPLLIVAHPLLEKYSQAPLSVEQVVRWNWFAPLLILALVVGLTVLVTKGHDRLPVLVAGGNFVSLAESPVGGIVMGLNLLAVVVMATVVRLRTVGQIGLLLAVVASVLDVWLTLHSHTRFSLGWYMARCNSLMSAASVLFVFLYEIGWLYHRVQDLNAALSRLAFVDELTGLANRRQFNERLQAEWRRSWREQQNLALILLDVDFFKKFNDLYGHPAGDFCLQQVARVLAASLRRPADLACRYGGEEFAIILPHTSRDGALFVAEALAEAVRTVAIPHAQGTDLGVVTISLGVAVACPETAEQEDSLLAAADQALYQAKASGRNRACLAP